MSTQRKIWLFFTVSVIFFLFSTSGKPAGLSKIPQRIISLGPALTEEIYLLGAEDRLIANTIYCQHPAAARKKEKIGTVVEVNVEKIVSLKPDMVLATALSNPEQMEKLKTLGIKVVYFPQAGSFMEICDQFARLGRILGKEKKAKEIILQAQNKVNSVTAKVRDYRPVKVFIEVGTKPLFTVTKDSFVNDFIKLAGGVNIAYGAKSGLYSREKVLQQNPDIIIIVTMGIEAQEEKEKWQEYKTLKAVKNDRIYIVDSYKIGSPTPVSFVNTLKEMVKIFHNE